MTRTVKGVRYRKWRSPNSAPRSFGQGRGRPGYAGRVHFQYWDKAAKAWMFLCGKRDGYGARGDVVDDETPITCTRCVKHAPDVVEKMETIPDLDEFQDLPVHMDDAFDSLDPSDAPAHDDAIEEIP